MGLSSQSGVCGPRRRKTLGHKNVNAGPRSSVSSERPFLTGAKGLLVLAPGPVPGTSGCFPVGPVASRDGPLVLWPESQDSSIIRPGNG